jgi:hypothetical protein
MYGKPAMTYFKYQVHLYGSEAHLKENFKIVKLPYLCKNQRENRMVGEPSHGKQLSLNHVCKINYILNWSWFTIKQSILSCTLFVSVKK